ncbi:MAG: hypothetical protein KGJ06_03735 [Pseudomonadota bacterium]|nr:hypothetical protein [Pseudomonadota bacterium]
MVRASDEFIKQLSLTTSANPLDTRLATITETEFDALDDSGTKGIPELKSLFERVVERKKTIDTLFRQGKIDKVQHIMLWREQERISGWLICWAEDNGFYKRESLGPGYSSDSGAP